MRKQMNILVAVACLAILGAVGCGSKKSSTAPGDTVPPSAVIDLSGEVSTQASTSVSLSWKAGVELDLVGYNIYRSVNQGSSQLVTTTANASWKDQSTQRGNVYSYDVSAVDASDNESTRASTGALSIESPSPPTKDQLD